MQCQYVNHHDTASKSNKQSADTLTTTVRQTKFNNILEDY
jgi:hypothetical protein